MAVTANKKEKFTKKARQLGAQEIQTSIFDIAPPGYLKKIDCWPTIYKTEKDYEYYLDYYLDRGFDVGFDIETDIRTKKPNIIGIGFYDENHTNNGVGVSVPYSSRLSKLTIAKTIRAKKRLVGHNVVTADKPWIEKEIGIKTSLSDWFDTMLTHYGVNTHLTKIAIKEEEDDDNMGGGTLGLMNLWAACRCLPLPLRNWKECRGSDCAAWGDPCPYHRRFEYNAIDSWAGSALQHFHLRYFEENDIPLEFIKHLHSIEMLGWLMRRKGVKIDRVFVDEFDIQWQKKVKELEDTLPFNAKSPKEIMDWFDKVQKGIPNEDKYKLEDTQRSSIQSLLDDLSEAVPGYKELETLFQIKAAGKGVKSWFDDYYFRPFDDLTDEEIKERKIGDRYSYVHPRFNGIGTATLRLSSSNPNFQNIPSKGALAELRKAIKARNEWEKLVKADAKQLEVRIALYDYGVDPNLHISLDPFTELVKLGGGVFEDVADRLNSDPNATKKWKPRDVAKSVAHGATNGEGLETATEEYLKGSGMQLMLEKGAIRLFKDWTLGDRLVYTTGSNLSRRIFGNSNYANRKLAIELLFDQYYKLIPQIPLWHRVVSKEVFKNGFVRGLGGSILWLDNPDIKENFKAAFSVKTQGGGAYFMRGKMEEFYELFNETPIVMVHDEFVWGVNRHMPPKEIVTTYDYLGKESKLLKNLLIPFEYSEGPSWGECKEIKL